MPDEIEPLNRFSQHMKPGRCPTCGRELAAPLRNNISDTVIIEALNRFSEYHIKPGDFLYCMLRNDLAGALARADDVNITRLPTILAYMTFNIPPASWGTPEKVDAWLSQRKHLRE